MSRVPKSVLAYAKKPVGALMMRPILLRLLEDPRFRVYGAARMFGRAQARRLFRQVGLEGVHVVPKAWARWAQFDLYLSADFGVAAPRSRRLVHVFHGVSFRNHAVHPNALRYDCALLVGRYMRRQFHRMGLLDAGNLHRFPLVGMPKLDPLVRGEYDRTRVLLDHDLDPALPTVLYAPTWTRRVSSLEHHGEELLRRLAGAPWNVLVKLHDNSLDPRKAGRDWKAVVRSLENERFRMARGFDVVPLLAAADVLVSDASSVAYEFCLLDRPVLFVDVEDIERRLKPKADLETWGRKVGDVVPGPARLLDAIEKALAEPGRKSELRRALAADLFHDPGRATDRALSVIFELLGLEPQS